MTEEKYTHPSPAERGQSMVEYVLIVVLVILAFAIAIAATGPAVGNVFSNVIYNLLGADAPDGGLGDLSVDPFDPDQVAFFDYDSEQEAEAFWLTVTWVSQQTPVEIPLPTRTPAPPTPVPTAGPSPTNTPVTPTKTATPTNTPAPTNTPVDFQFVAPQEFTADEKEYWRLDNDLYLGSDPGWYGQYYANRALTGVPDAEFYNTDLDPSLKYTIDFNWGSSTSPLGPNWPNSGEENWGVSWRRQIYLESATTLRFDIPYVNNGVRLWILGGSYGGNPDVQTGGPNGCSSTGNAYTTGLGVHVSSHPSGDGNDWFIYDDADTYSNDCLIVERWAHGDSSSRSNILRTVPAGIYTLQLDYYEEVGSAAITMNVSSPGIQTNPDDTRIATSGSFPTSPQAGTTNCNWQLRDDGRRSNSRDNLYDEYGDGNFATGNRCFLELRGSVEIPATMTNPTLTFWDAWDFRGTGVRAFVQLADYDPNGDGIFVRSDLVWKETELHRGDSTNYNYTHQVIDLTNVGGTNFIGKKVAIRFGMENINYTGTRRWYIDTIRFDELNQQTFYPNMFWDMNDTAHAADFITSGRWEQTNTKAKGGQGLSWEDSPGRYYDSTDRRDSTFNDYNLRMHTIEFNGWVKLDDPAIGIFDLENDTGDPLLSFWHSYDINRRTGLEVQYSTDPYSAGDAAQWRVVPGGGSLISRSSSSKPPDVLSMEFVEIPLVNLVDNGGNPAGTVRLRFAMTVYGDTEQGWWIDSIQLERLGRAKYSDYPFHDPAEDITNEEDWLLGGSWGRVDGGYAPPVGETGTAYTDSPTGNFAQNSDSAMELKWPFDLFMDSPANPKSPACNLGSPVCDEPDALAPVDPVLSFWHWRRLSGGDHIYVEWRRIEDSTWNEAWVYIDRMTTTESLNSRTRDSIAWERVFIDMAPIVADVIANDNVADPHDDDITFRIRLKTDGGSADDGVYIDDIRVQERVENVHYLWPSTESRLDETGSTIVDTGGSPIFGTDEEYYNGLDNTFTTLFDDWHIGGTWDVIDWEQWKGLYAFHDSPEGQVDAPPDSPTPLTNHTSDTFNVLELDTIIDLRGVQANEDPIMYFWTRYQVRSSSRTLRVQISFEDSTVLGSSGYCRDANRDQCYEHRYGWSAWQTVWERQGTQQINTWQREQVTLAPYAQQGGGIAGKRIRIRFVTDILEGGSNYDGWYIDDITLKYYDPDVIVISKTAVPGSFFDPARNLQNWVAEGTWGLSPEFFRGSGGGPVSLGASLWNYYYFDVDHFSSSSSTFKNNVANFLDTTPNSAADHSGVVLDINNDWGYGGPVSGWNTNRFAGRWELTTGVVGTSLSAGTYTFITISDEGIRFKYDTSPGGGLPPPGPSDPPIYSQTGWNIINNWTYHGRTVDMGTANFASGNRYKLTLEWFERWSKAVVILTTGSNSFSFTDSPKQSNGPAFPEIPAVKRGNSSLILDGVFDLSGATSPIIEYYTYHELGGTARVEVTTDGGFTWTNSGLRGSPPLGIFTSNWTGNYFDNLGQSGQNADRLDYLSQAGSFYQSRNDGTDINFNWGSQSPISGWITNDFGIRWTRTMNLATPLTITFRTTTDDGHRLWLDYSPGCETYSGNPIFSGMGKTNNDRVNSDPSTSCLLIDDWENSSNNVKSVTRTIPAGNHTLQYDYYDDGGGAKARLEMFAGTFDDPFYGGSYMPVHGGWRQKLHDLSQYAGLPAVGLRFRLDRIGQTSTNNQTQSPINWLTSWWVVDITVLDP